MEQLLINSFVAGGTLNPHRFVKYDPTAEDQVLHSGAGERIIGITDRVGSPPSVPAATVAAAGERVDVVLLGITDIELADSVFQGQYLKAGADGKGVGADASSDNIGALALNSGDADEIIRCLLIHYPEGLSGS